MENGVVTKIDESTFISFHVKNSSGKTTGFFWLTFIENNLELQLNFNEVLNKFVQIKYVKQELFDQGY